MNRSLIWLPAVLMLIGCGARSESSIGRCLESQHSEAVLWSEQGWVVGKAALDGPWTLEVRSTSFSDVQTYEFEWEIQQDYLIARDSGGSEESLLVYRALDHLVLGMDGEGSCVTDIGPLRCNTAEDMGCSDSPVWYERSGVVVDWSTALAISPQVLRVTSELAGVESVTPEEPNLVVDEPSQRLSRIELKTSYWIDDSTVGLDLRLQPKSARE